MRQQRSLYIDLRPEKPLAAVVSNLESPFVIEKIVPLENISALKELCRAQNPTSRYTRAVVAVYPDSRFLRQTSIENPTKAREEKFFEELLKTQYQLSIEDYLLMILNPSTGLAVDLEKVVPKDLLLVGARQEEFLQTQSAIVEQSVYPQRLELGSLSILGGVMNYQHQQQMSTSVAVLEWGAKQSLFSICSAKRLELSRVIPFGSETLLHQIKTDLGLKDEASVLKLLSTGNFDFAEMGPMFLKNFIRELQASMGFFEVQTGQAIRHLVIQLLPETFSWAANTVSRSLSLDFLPIDYEGWANTHGIKAREGEVKFSELSRDHIGLMSLMINNLKQTNGEKESN